MAHPYFILISGSAADPDGPPPRYLSQAATAGPWSPDLQHGGPPNALAVAVAEQALSAATGRSDLRALRLAADFVGPVPVAEIVARPRVLRVARSAALVEVTLSTAAGGSDRACLVSRIWFVRDTDTRALAPEPGPAVDVPEVEPGLGADFPYGRSLEWRFVSGGMRQPGPAQVWVRPSTPLLPEHGMSALARAVLVADSASGISAELAWDEWSFVNVDLDVHLFRPGVGEWLSMSATTHLGPHGSAMARSTLADRHGAIGAGLQTLVVSPMRR